MARPLNNRVGEKFTTHEGYPVEIVEYLSKSNCTVSFENGFTMYNIEYKHVVSGQIKNPYHKSVYGVGYIGEGEHKVTVNLKMTPANLAWRSMLSRCHDKETQKRQPTYVGCSIYEPWYCFQVFAQWFEENRKVHMDKTWQFDKDILIKGNKHYSPETCCFVPKEINSLFTKCDKARGEYPIGVLKRINRYIASISKNGKRMHIGSYMTPESAFRSYKIEKEAYIKEVANKYKNLLESRVYEAMCNWIVEITD